MQLAELVKLLEKDYPLAQDQEGLRYSDEYAMLEEEQQKLNSMHGEKPDYAKMIEQGLKLLEQGAGYFFVLTAIVNAMLQQYKWPGFAAGVDFLHARLSKQWDGLYPAVERMKGRVQPMDWLVERLVQFMETAPLTGLGKDFLKKLHESLLSLDEVCQEKFAGQISLMSLIRPLEDQNKRQQLEEQAREQQAKLDEEQRQQEAEQAEIRKQQAALGIEPEVISQDEYLQNMNAVELHILASKRLMAEQLEILKSDPGCYAIYKHNRAEMWWRYPLSSQELLNLIDEQGFDWERYSEVLKIKAEGRYEEAVLAFEALSHEFPFYLPLQFHICDCLRELQVDSKLLEMLKAECKAVYQEHPELADAKINNELAVLDYQTKVYFDLFTDPITNESQAPS